MLKKKISVLTAIILCVIISVATAAACYFIMPFNNLSRKVNEVTNIINNNFDGEINDEVIDEAVFNALIKSLNDKYGAYYNTDDSNDFFSRYEKDNEGLGIDYALQANGNIIAILIHANSPADKAGIKLYDEIIAIDNLTIKDDGARKILEYVSNKPIDDNVNIKLLRDGKVLEFNVTIGIYEKQTVFYENIDDVGYIKITHFDDSTINAFKLALNNLKAQNIKSLLFDVRYNTGGTVNAVSDVLDVLLPECDIISVKYKNGVKKVLRHSDSKCETIPMAVLINGNTASASELFAAAIKEMNNGKLIGEKTYGKGTIQSVFEISDGSVLKISVGKFYTPRGNNFDGVGIKPDIEVKTTEDQNKTYYLLTTENDPVIIKGIESLK